MMKPDTTRLLTVFNPFMPTGAFNICCPRDCVSRHNGGTSGAPLKPLRVDSALRALLSLRGLRGAPEVPPLCRETQSLGQQMLNASVGINFLVWIQSRYQSFEFNFGNYQYSVLYGWGPEDRNCSLQCKMWKRRKIDLKLLHSNNRKAAQYVTSPIS